MNKVLICSLTPCVQRHMTIVKSMMQTCMLSTDVSSKESWTFERSLCCCTNVGFSFYWFCGSKMIVC